jgi:hypothetical protein
MSYLKAVLHNMDEGKISEIYKKKEETNNKKIEVNVDGTKKYVPKFKKRTNFKKNPKKISKELEEAMQKTLNECLPSKELVEELSLIIGFTKNWQKTIPINIEDDEIIISSSSVSDKKRMNVNQKKEFKFSKKRFLLSRDFRNILITEYNKIFNNVYLSLFQSKKDENIFYIKLSQKN